MSALVFELKGKPDQRLDLSPLVPERLKDLKSKDIEALTIGSTRMALTVGDAFKVKGNDASELRFVGTDGRCDKIGAGLKDGIITVEGDVAAYLGAGMKRGKIEVNGNAGVLAGASMAGGRIAISGDVAERAGGILVGETMGMKGGVLTIGGNAGPLVGERMRRDRRRHHSVQAQSRARRRLRPAPRQPDLRRGAGRAAADLRRLRRDGVRLSAAA